MNNDTNKYFSSLQALKNSLEEMATGEATQPASEHEMMLLKMLVDSTKMIHELIEMNQTFSKALDVMTDKNDQLAEILYQNHVASTIASC